MVYIHTARDWERNGMGLGLGMESMGSNMLYNISHNINYNILLFTPV